MIRRCTPEKKRCDHPSNGEVVVAEDVDAKPGKAGMEETKIRMLIFLKWSTICRTLCYKTTNNITSTKQFLGVFSI